MKKIVIVILVGLISGCNLNVENTDNKGKRNISVSDLKTLQNAQIKTEKGIERLLNPLIDGILLEGKMIQGATYQEGMTLEDFREFMLMYYTEEIANETCDLIVYKSQLGFGVEYSSMFYFDESTDIFYYESAPVEVDCSTCLQKNVVFSENDQIEIYEITSQTEDRIELSIKIERYENGEKQGAKYIPVILEREGNDWYLGDLVSSRETINEANREFENK